MSGRVQMTGLDALMRELTNAPEDIRTEARAIVREATEGAASEMAHRYPVGKTGTLRRRVRTSYPSSVALVGIAQNAAPHSHLYEFGTRQRQTSRGANRGSMPEARPEIVVPIAQKHRARMFDRLVDMLQRRGFQVSE